jgi:hypothetical protein
MRVISVSKVMLLIGAVAVLSSLSGTTSHAAKKTMKMPPGSCAFEKKSVANGTLCSYDCNPSTMWCSQQRCQNGQFTQFLLCFGSFCSPKCDG